MITVSLDRRNEFLCEDTEWITLMKACYKRGYFKYLFEIREFVPFKPFENFKEGVGFVDNLIEELKILREEIKGKRNLEILQILWEYAILGKTCSRVFTIDEDIPTGII